MHSELKKTTIHKVKRKIRIRKRLKADANRHRLSVFKTNKNLFAQLIDDINSKTVASISNISKEIKGTELAKVNTKTAHELGAKLAELALKKKVDSAVFDRGSNKYHGLLAAFAEGARAKGLKI